MALRFSSTSTRTPLPFSRLIIRSSGRASADTPSTFLGLPVGT